MDPFTWIAIATLVIGAATAGTAAHQQNQAAKKSMRAHAQAAEIQQRQLNEAANLEAKKRRAEADQIRGRLRIRNAASGVGGAGTYEALDRQNSFDEALNLNILERNRFNESERVRSGLQASFADLEARTMNPILAAFGGGASGAATGLGIAGGLRGGGAARPSAGGADTTAGMGGGGDNTGAYGA